MTDVRWAAEADDAAVAGYVAARLDRAGPRSIAVPGGRTPEPILADLARRAIGWGEVRVTLTDDRIVPRDHPASNFGLLTRTLGATDARLEPLAEGAAPGRFDLVWIGMGEDGHVASLFPGGPVADDAPPQIVRVRPDPLPPEAPFDRLTLTLAALTATDALILVARGAAKRALLDAAVAGTSDRPVARLLRAAICPVTIFWSP